MYKIIADDQSIEVMIGEDTILYFDKDRSIEDLFDDIVSLLDCSEIDYTASYNPDEEEDSDKICGHCNGSGEGLYEGRSCIICKGSGTC